MKHLLSLTICWTGWIVFPPGVAIALPPPNDPSLSAVRQPAETENVIVERDVEYGRAGGKPLKLDVLQPRSAGKKLRPAIIYIHGGAWKYGEKSEGIAVLKPLVQTGDYVGFTVAYRLSGTVPWPAQIHDCKAAVRWVRTNAKKYRVDPDRIGVCGVSAGGHLVNMLGVTGDRKELEGKSGSPGISSRVQCVVNNCGPTDLPNIGFKDPNDDDLLVTLFGGPLKKKAAELKAASPIYYVRKGCPPFLHLHGTKDPIVNYQSQAVAFHKALKKAGVDSTLVALEGGGHPAAGPEADRRLRAFFDKHLLGKVVEVSAEPIRVKGP
ncbi:MAG: alpha/beta hydrolase [Pirellulales bacterium]|nr:alpha/beta hydrolase [Pirellulales bacterium]